MIYSWNLENLKLRYYATHKLSFIGLTWKLWFLNVFWAFCRKEETNCIYHNSFNWATIRANYISNLHSVTSQLPQLAEVDFVQERISHLFVNELRWNYRSTNLTPLCVAITSFKTVTTVYTILNAFKYLECSKLSLSRSYCKILQFSALLLLPTGYGEQKIKSMSKEKENTKRNPKVIHYNKLTNVP